MELQFSNQGYDCMKSALWEDKTEEMTQEFRLSDGMPDIGSMIGAWGQVMVRSKEWQDRSISVSGGVTAWALYTPENGNAPEPVEIWIPFRMQWDLPEASPDGSILVSCKVKSVDARSVSARRILFRAVISVTVEALTPTKIQIFKPCELPDDVQLLHKKYPMRLPMETGEKAFMLDEELSLSVDADGVNKLVRCCVQPEIIDKKIMADKAVFRGTAILDILCRCDDGNVVKQSFEIPFSQYAELSREFGPGSSLFIQMALTGVEPELLEDGSVRIKIGMIGQYVVNDSEMIEIVEDAYSTKRDIKLQTERLEIPAILEERQERIRAEQSIEIQDTMPVDMGLLLGNPEVYHDFNNVSVGLSGAFYYMSDDQEGTFRSHNIPWKHMTEMSTGQNIKVFAWSQLSGKPQISQTPEGMVVRQDTLLDTRTVCTEPMRMISGLTLGDMQQTDTLRPSLIVCKPGGKTLWELAKENGSTMDAITQLNDLTEESWEDKMLLIPVI